jgi:hypothetical protein
MPTLNIPLDTYNELATRAALENISLDDLASRLLTIVPAGVPTIPLDDEYYAECLVNETEPPTLEEVRQIISKLPVKLSTLLQDERDERR